MRRCRLGLLVALTFAFAPAASAQTTIGAPGGGEVRSFGKPDTQTYGQTITALNDLLSFSFWLGRESPISLTSPVDLHFQAYVYAWDAALKRASGAQLFASAVNHHHTDVNGSFIRFDFNTGNLALTPGNVYVLFVSSSGLAGNGRIFMESNIADAYLGGDFFFMNNGENQGDWTSVSWAGPQFGSTTDLRFEATFVPEPATWLLLATGLLAMGIVARNRRREGIDTHVA